MTKNILILIAFVLVASTSNWAPVYTDTTMTGQGTEDSPLKVDTARLATRYYTATYLTKPLTPAQITSDQDNYSPTGIGAAGVVRISGDNGIRAITGITDSIAGALEKTLINIGSYPIYLPMDHPDSDAAHRFTGHSGDFILHPGQSCKILYDLTNFMWRIIGDVNHQSKKAVIYSLSAGSNVVGDNSIMGLLAISSGFILSTVASTTIPASWELSTQATTTGGGELYFTKSMTQFTAFASAHIYAEAYLTVPTVSDGTNTYTSELQITASPTSGNLENNNMFGIRYSHGINSGKWELFSQSNTGTETVADLGVTVASTTSYRLAIYVDKSKTEARAYVDGIYAGRVTGTLPNSVVCGARIVQKKSAGTTDRALKVHSFSAGAIYP